MLQTVASIGTAIIAVSVAVNGAAAQAPATTARQAGGLTQNLPELSEHLEALVAQVAPSVVQVLATGYSVLPQAGTTSHAHTEGSGVILDANGYIVTNAHVVADARRVRVALAPSGQVTGRSVVRPRGRLLDAAIVGIDLETDLAVLKVEEKGLRAMALAESDDLRQGNLVLAFGSPLGLENSVTLGVVSAVGRQREREDPMVYVQTDAPINPGSSGGPLVDATGRVVGINTYVVTRSGGHEGVGFAVPSNIVRTVFEQLRANGRVRRGTLGLLTQTISPLMAVALGLSRTQGVIVADVAAQSPGEAAGLRPGDIIVTLDGRPMENARQFDVNLYRRRIGDTVTLEFERGGETMRTTAAVAERPDDPARFAELVDAKANLVERLGILGVSIDARIAAQLPGLRTANGVLVAARVAEGPGGDGSLATGDVIIAVNQTPVTNLTDLRARISQLPPGGTCVLQVQRGHHFLYVVLEVE